MILCDTSNQLILISEEQNVMPKYADNMERDLLLKSVSFHYFKAGLSVNFPRIKLDLLNIYQPLSKTFFNSSSQYNQHVSNLNSEILRKEIIKLFNRTFHDSTFMWLEIHRIHNIWTDVLKIYLTFPLLEAKTYAKMIYSVECLPSLQLKYPILILLCQSTLDFSKTGEITIIQKLVKKLRWYDFNDCFNNSNNHEICDSQGGTWNYNWKLKNLSVARLLFQ